MSREKLRIPLPVVVEGKYDKMKLSSVIDAHIVTTEGFGIFNKSEKRTLIKKLAQAGGIVVLTDSDRGGRQIRSYLSSILPEGAVYSLHIPKVEGCERRKRRPSAAGTLGVEGMDEEVLYDIFRRFSERMGFSSGEGRAVGGITKAMLFELGLTGAGSAARRDAVCTELGLPAGMSAAAFHGAVDMLLTREELYGLCGSVFGEAAEDDGEL